MQLTKEPLELLNKYAPLLAALEQAGTDTRVFVVVAKTSKPLPTMADHIGGRVWTLDGVEGADVQEVKL